MFKDMFSLPAGNGSLNTSEPIHIDEKADVLALVLTDIHK
jgi:hypothetical protein